jgi:hypothetical protein
VREEVFGALLDKLQFDEEVLDWMRDALKASYADERREQQQAIQRCQTQYKRLEDRLQAMYLDKLDGRIDNAFYDSMSAQWRVEQARLLREIERHSEAQESYMEDGLRLLELARDASQLFAKQAANFRQPFDHLQNQRRQRCGVMPPG